MLVDAFTRAKREPEVRAAIYRLYMRRIGAVNNWDLVDSSAPHIVGAWLTDGDRSVLDRLARSPVLWRRRIAMIATQHFIRAGESEDALRIAELLVGDREDLIHKAVGWMLREVGQSVGPAPLRGFLREHAATMPRTMLRYAIEKLTDAERKRWLRTGTTR
jgi:3-methyladenine DNA glycosylase AlkD